MISVTGQESGRGRTAPVLLLGLSVIVLLAAVFAAARFGRERAAAELGDRVAAAWPLATASLTSVIEKERLIPLVLARDPEVISLLAAPAPEPEARLDAKLADIAEDAGAAVIYLVNTRGIAIAASNAGARDSFVGNEYAFRTYFTEAMRSGAGSQYALGTVSRRPGLYLSRRVDGVNGPLGVVVVKVEFDQLEANWRASGFAVHVTDARGVVLATSVPDWRFRTAAPLDNEEAVRQELQVDGKALDPLPLTLGADGLARVTRGEQAGTYAHTAGPVGAAAPGWSLTLLGPADGLLAEAARRAELTALLAGLLLMAGGAALIRRRRGALARQTALAGMNAELERRVEGRTEELNRSNAALAAEIAEREGAETRVRQLRDELAQANRLSILGQIAAGVAHEINQPVAAIRTYAETGAQLIAAERAGDARENLREIVKVTDRIGSITQMLRGFSRRASGAIGPVEVEEAIDGALALLAGRVRDAGARIDRGPRRVPVLRVLAGRIRLEQILVNLLQNALDATRDQRDAVIAIRVVASTETVAITVSDNGPGLSPDMREQLFIPFATTKEKGLGLGLVISNDIAREFGGSLRHDPGERAGASFTLELRRAA